MNTTGVISVAQWEAWSPREKSKIIDQLWQIPGAVESMGQGWKVVQLLLSWGCTVEWMPALEEDARKAHYHYCVIDTERSKIALKQGVGYGPSLSESLCCAALRCVELLALQ